MFHKELIKIHDTGQSRSIIVCGNVHDLFYDGKDFIPLIPFLCKKTQTKGLIHLVYELNGPIRMESEDKAKLKAAWLEWQVGDDPLAVLLRELPKTGRNTVQKHDDAFESHLRDSIGNPTVALEFLRQLTICSRAVLKENLFIIIEAADMLLPTGTGDVASLNDSQLHRIIIASDWLGDPAFYSGHDTVLFIAESRSLVHPRISKLPQVLSVEVESPDTETRKLFLETTDKFKLMTGPQRWPSIEAKKIQDEVAALTAGLSICALQQLVKGAASAKELKKEDIVKKVEEYIQSQVGEGVVEFKKPTHTLDDCVGFTKLKKFLRETLIPRMQTKGDGSLSGAAVAGPIGCHRKGQLILTYDGELKKVEDIQKGDYLMGLDSTLRSVKSLIKGQGKMYLVRPVKGEPFVVNEDHVLSLKRTKSRNKRTDNKAGEIINISVKECLTWSKSRKGLYKLFRTGVKFKANNVQKLPINPYFLGVLLGDGSFVTSSPSVTSLDFEVIAETVKQSKVFKLPRPRIALQKETKAITLFLSGRKKVQNPLTFLLIELELWGKKSGFKFVPQIYLTSTRKNRLEILAGLLDTDGSYDRCFDFTSKSEKLCDGVCFLARSLGFAAYKSGPHLKTNQYGSTCLCWRVCVSGNLEQIPTRIPRKKATSRKQKKSVLVTGFKIEDLQIEEDFYGFELNGDGRYLLGDFTVTHNSGKTYIFEAVASELDMPVVVLKNIRSQWFGQTDVVFERLRRVLEALDRVLIFVDEADTQFGGVGEGTHATERRLTGKIQAMMSDTKLKGKVYWLLMTARIHLLSPDIRRPGRVGDLIIPVFDPEGEDRLAFIRWVLE